MISSPGVLIFNFARALGEFNTAAAGPGSNNRVVVVGFNQNQSKSAAPAGARGTRGRR